MFFLLLWILFFPCTRKYETTYCPKSNLCNVMGCLHWSYDNHFPKQPSPYNPCARTLNTLDIGISFLSLPQFQSQDNTQILPHKFCLCRLTSDPPLWSPFMISEAKSVISSLNNVQSSTVHASRKSKQNMSPNTKNWLFTWFLSKFGHLGHP